ncbi:GntR family transcriptional regulator [Streptomyces marispadix]|uniref:GntR family transcriptional regulator n=1 Tax=Streptomyces marispadix TaxID=2922868 RepID=UPI001F1387B1|nr:GntR family transcriptional regulator [Streptomyces marispadix]
MTVARYQRVADSIRERIADGTLSAGDRLPTEPLLVDEYAVSRLTVRHALDVLQAEGLIERFHGRGTFVRRRPQRVSYVSACSGGFRQSEADHVDTETYVRHGSVLAEAPLTALMQVEPGTELAEYLYFSRRDKDPYSLARIYVPLDLAKLLDTPTAKLPWGAEIPLGLEAAGIRLAHVTERVTTRPPTQDEAGRLNLPPGAVVLEVERTSVDDQGRVVEGAQLVAPQDRIEVVFSKALAKSAGGDLS